MAFVQIIEFRTFDIEPTRQINKQWWQAMRACDRAPRTTCP